MLATILAVFVLVAMPLSNNAAAASGDDLIQLARAHVTINPNGLFVVDRGAGTLSGARLHATFDRLNAEMAKVDSSQRPTLQRRLSPQPVSVGIGAGRLASLAARFCGYVPKWAYQAFAWYIIISGAVIATFSLVAAGTIFGLPAAPVLAAAGIWVGISGSLMLWLIDNYMPPQGVYVCIF